MSQPDNLILAWRVQNWVVDRFSTAIDSSCHRQPYLRWGISSPSVDVMDRPRCEDSKSRIDGGTPPAVQGYLAVMFNEILWFMTVDKPCPVTETIDYCTLGEEELLSKKCVSGQLIEILSCILLLSTNSQACGTILFRIIREISVRQVGA